MYATGEGVPRDLVEAVAWYRQAADQGWAEAQNALGSMYATGRGGCRTAGPSELGLIIGGIAEQFGVPTASQLRCQILRRFPLAAVPLVWQTVCLVWRVKRGEL